MIENRMERGKRILEWYLINKREMPWRETNDPYKIWVSEIMLQQTRVDTVIDYYNRFIERFPDVRALAEAREEEVLTVWKGLGYYSRARNLHKAAKEIMVKYDGKFPTQLEQVRDLPGIGAYTAGAIVSIAYNQPQPAVDGNVLRVISRLEASEQDITKESTKKLVGDVVLQMIPEGEARDFNQALMELGALVCIPATPRCSQCPVQSLCEAFQSGRQNELPLKKKKEAASPEIRYWVAVIEKEDRMLLEYREKETLLGKLWGFPMVEKAEGKTKEVLFEEKYGFLLQKVHESGRTNHIFSHRIWTMDVGEYALLSPVSKSSTLRWIPKEELKNMAIPTAFQKVLKLTSQPYQQLGMDV